jgi:uncharacterized protein (TIGR04255 family)
MNWEPAHADHSIEWVNVVLSLAIPIDADLFDEVLVAARKIAASHQFTHRTEGIEPLQIQGQPGAQILVDLAATSTRRRVTFQRLVEGKPIGEFAVGSSTITLSWSRYSSWTAFKTMALDLLAPVQPIAPILDGIRTIQLQYLDRFTSTVVQANAFEVVKKSSSLLVSAVNTKTRAFHTHSGWFDYLDNSQRRLTNVNIDLTDNSPPTEPDAMSRLGILTMARIEALAGTLDDPLSGLDRLHLYLKELFNDLITKEAADRVSLNN